MRSARIFAQHEQEHDEQEDNSGTPHSEACRAWLEHTNGDLETPVASAGECHLSGGDVRDARGVAWRHREHLAKVCDTIPEPPLKPSRDVERSIGAWRLPARRSP